MYTSLQHFVQMNVGEKMIQMKIVSVYTVFFSMICHIVFIIFCYVT